MGNLSSCPDASRLRQLLDGTLPEAEQAQLVAHLDACLACQQQLEELAGGQAVSAQATVALSSQSLQPDVPLQRVLDGLKTDTRTTLVHWPGSPTLWIQSFLSPVPATDLLGRLDTYDVTE